MVEKSGNEALIFDRARLRNTGPRPTSKNKDFSFLDTWAVRQLETRLADVKRTFPSALLMGRAAQINAKPGQIENLIHMRFAKDEHKPDVLADEEFLPLREHSLDLVISLLNLHAVNDLPGTLIQIRRALKPDGMFLAVMFGGETLYELRQSLMQAELQLKNGVSPRVFPFADKPQMGALLQRAGFALPVVDSEIVTVTYKDMFGLIEDLRGMGERNIINNRSRTNPGKKFFMDAARSYADKFSDADGRIRASFEMIFLIGWAPHESQQKPLAPGSARSRLADALGAQEMKTAGKAAP
jgi:SAM-dependent methyltransferase